MLLFTQIVLLLISLRGVFAVDTFNIDITNGTCYYAAGKELPSVYSPAGNSVLGHTFCCQLGHKLNNHNVCVGDTSAGTYTYIAGCTDPAYENESCPFKANYTDYKWVGLTLCSDDADSSGSVPWVGCDNDGSDTVRASSKSQGCTCDLSGNNPDQPVFTAAKALDAWGVLPSSTLDTISWFGGYPLSTVTPWMTDVPASTATGHFATVTGSITTSQDASIGTTTIGTRTSSVTRVDPTATSTHPISTTEGSSDWSTGQKAGLGAGVGLATLLVCLGICFAIYRHMKKRSFAVLDVKKESDTPTSPTRPTTMSIYDGERSMASPSNWKGYMNELPADAPPHPGTLVRRSYSNDPVEADSIQSPRSPSRGSPMHMFGLRSPTDEMRDEMGHLPNDQRPSWAQTSQHYGQSQQYARGGLHERYVQESVGRRSDGIAELPG